MFHLSIVQRNSNPFQLCDLRSAILEDGFLQCSRSLSPDAPLTPGQSSAEPKAQLDRASLVDGAGLTSIRREVEDGSGYRWELSPLERAENEQACFLLVNHGQPLRLSDGRRVHAGGSLEISNPFQLFQGQTLIDILPGQAPRSMSEGIRSIPNRNDASQDPQLNVSEVGLSPSGITLAHWFDCLGRLQRIGAGSAELFQQAASSLVEPGGLDGGLLLIRSSDPDTPEPWKIVGWSFPQIELGFAFAPCLIELMKQQRRTLFHSSHSAPDEIIDQHYNMQVCAPIQDANDEIIGALVGIRAFHRMNQRRGIRPLEAQFVQLVADCITAGMIRRKQESELVHKQVLLEQAFPPKIAQQLISNPDTLQATKRDVSVLFCDMRGFSKVSEGIEGQMLYRLLSHVMDYLTQHLHRCHGTVIDYFGDGVAAFWNAPIDQVQHHDLACRAAFSIFADLEELNSEWGQLLGMPVRLGIGIHSGSALVGNSGSQYRIKYGPRGQTVNIACRIEAATKHVGVPFLVSETFANCLSDQFGAIRVGRMRLPGMEQPANVYHPWEKDQDDLLEARNQHYRTALAQFEAEQFAACCNTLQRFRESSQDRLIEYLYSQALAREEGRFERRHSDDTANFIPLPIHADTQA